MTDEFVVVDYVNDEIDTRVQSQALDGVPDEIMESIAKQLVKIQRKIYDKTTRTRPGGFHLKAAQEHTMRSQTYQA
ncbi:MAG: hypothetical protein IPL71_24705 [Anaerolineales bacterium]|uniref:hypothetical protein n=1 Tax=Candidatus Villigracilis proximus TaxID=3140683 RepID=UPI0031376BDF|nr:hypothetical protein [Anaerolineales bacterium]